MSCQDHRDIVHETWRGTPLQAPRNAPVSHALQEVWSAISVYVPRAGGRQHIRAMVSLNGRHAELRTRHGKV